MLLFFHLRLTLKDLQRRGKDLLKQHRESKKRALLLVLLLDFPKQDLFSFRCCPVYIGGSSVVNGVGTVTSKRSMSILLSSVQSQRMFIDK